MSLLIIAGENQPPLVHALAHAMNHALGNAGITVTYSEPVCANPENQGESLACAFARHGCGPGRYAHRARRQSGLFRTRRFPVWRSPKQCCDDRASRAQSTTKRRRAAIGISPRRTFSKRGPMPAPMTARLPFSNRCLRHSMPEDRRTNCSRCWAMAQRAAGTTSCAITGEKSSAPISSSAGIQRCATASSRTRRSRRKRRPENRFSSPSPSDRRRPRTRHSS